MSDSEDSCTEYSDVPSDKEPLLSGKAKKPRVLSPPAPSTPRGRNGTSVATSNGAARSTPKPKVIPLTNMAAGTGNFLGVCLMSVLLLGNGMQNEGMMTPILALALALELALGVINPTGGLSESVLGGQF